MFIDFYLYLKGHDNSGDISIWNYRIRINWVCSTWLAVSSSRDGGSLSNHAILQLPRSRVPEMARHAGKRPVKDPKLTGHF